MLTEEQRQKRIEYRRAYKLRNAERVREDKRRYYERHRDELLEKRAAYNFKSTVALSKM